MVFCLKTLLAKGQKLQPMTTSAIHFFVWVMMSSLVSIMILLMLLKHTNVYGGVMAAFLNCRFFYEAIPTQCLNISESFFSTYETSQRAMSLR